MFKSILLFKENFNLRILRIKNAKFSGYYLYMNKKSQGMRISVPLVIRFYLQMITKFSI